ncbi:hypothetical protein QCA50_010938 [Cerrena zonata]|uniref:Peptidyl-prolyl cis-trans isomerase D n=1 Tax=Cerrena zonata TaxID=2478898 RepID=A0AAW0FZE4_9APHY
MVRPRTFFDLAVDNQSVGRVIFELFNDTAPKTCENFRALCTGEKGISPLSDKPLYYKSSIVHRSITDFMIQAGDFTKRNGMGGESIYGGPFPDEDLTRPVDSEGLLCMANKGPDTNGSQFFITLRDCPHLNGKHVVFGRVIRGYDVVQKIASVPVDEKDRPTKPIVIVNCGELVMRSKPQEENPEAKAKTHEKDAASSDESDHGARKKRRHRHRSPSRSGGSDASDSNQDKRERRKHRKKTKSKHKKRDTSKSRGDDPVDDSKKPGAEPEEETEEQYDARLEREEKERIEAGRRRELERIKRRLEDEAARASTNGVRFKGRGRMKYIDPELQHSR